MKVGHAEMRSKSDAHPSVAGSQVLTKWKYFSVSRSFTVKHKRDTGA